jgi:hypothetical protein
MDAKSSFMTPCALDDRGAGCMRVANESSVWGIMAGCCNVDPKVQEKDGNQLQHFVG